MPENTQLDDPIGRPIGWPNWTTHWMTPLGNPIGKPPLDDPIGKPHWMTPLGDPIGWPHLDAICTLFDAILDAICTLFLMPFWMHFGCHLHPFLTPFWMPFAPFLTPFWMPLETHWMPLETHWNPIGDPLVDCPWVHCPWVHCPWYTRYMYPWVHVGPERWYTSSGCMKSVHQATSRIGTGIPVFLSGNPLDFVVKLAIKMVRFKPAREGFLAKVAKMSLFYDFLTKSVYFGHFCQYFQLPGSLVQKERLQWAVIGSKLTLKWVKIDHKMGQNWAILTLKMCHFNPVLRGFYSSAFLFKYTGGHKK